MGLVFKTACAHDADFWGFWGTPHSSAPWGFAVGVHVNFGVVLGRRSDDARPGGRRQWRHPLSKALDTGSALDHGGRAGL